jgi:hypothetical protein
VLPTPHAASPQVEGYLHSEHVHLTCEACSGTAAELAPPTPPPAAGTAGAPPALAAEEGQQQPVPEPVQAQCATSPGDAEHPAEWDEAAVQPRLPAVGGSQAPPLLRLHIVYHPSYRVPALCLRALRAGEGCRQWLIARLAEGCGLAAGTTRCEPSGQLRLHTA